uniref:Uncharacterized protein n=1 Tax=Magallana gigas TaxID=29159 RepID=K1QV85_MAGGI
MRETDTNCSNGKRKKGKESKSASSWNGEEVKPKTRKWSSQGREKWVEDQALAKSTTAEEKKPIKKK